MKFVLLISILLPCALARPGLQIHGGKDASRNQFPYQISLQLLVDGDYIHLCGGTILSPVWILTAAHCTLGFSANQTRVVAGIIRLSDGDIPGKQIMAVRQIINHERYSRADFPYDIALVELAIPLVYGVGVQSVKVPRAGQVVTGVAILSGWGLLDDLQPASPDHLQYVDVPIISGRECEARIPFADPILNICTGVINGDESACGGDSGGPLAINGTVIGVVSFGIKPCGSGLPSVYTRTASFLDWITTNTNGDIIPS